MYRYRATIRTIKQGVITMVAPINARPNKEFMTIRIDTHIKDQLQEMADADQRSLSSMVTIILKRALMEAQHA